MAQAWEFWSAEQILKKLPELIADVLARPDGFSPRDRDKNKAAAESLRERPPTDVEILRGRREDFRTLGYALDSLGRRPSADADERLKFLHAAHEVLRAGNPARRPFAQMRRIVLDALTLLLQRELARARQGETDAGRIREALRGTVLAAWGFVPSQVELALNEALVRELEAARRAGEDDSSFHGAWLRENIQTVLSVRLPAALEGTRRRWVEVGRHVEPRATQIALEGVRRPEPLSALLGEEGRKALERAVGVGSVVGVAEALDPLRARLVANLRLRMDERLEFHEPAADVRFEKGLDRYYLEARRLLLLRDPQALDRFKKNAAAKRDNAIAAEWYAYALACFGQQGDIHEMVEKLEFAARPSNLPPEFRWTAHWNLACALRRLRRDAPRALEALRPILEMPYYLADAFENSLLWALEQEPGPRLSELLPLSPYFEASLLAALLDALSLRETTDPARFKKHFRRLNALLKDVDHLFPDPRERLSEKELARVQDAFLEFSLVQAGVEWFRQHLFYDDEQRFFKNWACAAELYEAAGEVEGAWRCRKEQWETTRANRNLAPESKQQALRALLTWAKTHGREADARELLAAGWEEAKLQRTTMELWLRELTPTVEPAPLGASPPAGAAATGPNPSPAPSPQEAATPVSASSAGTTPRLPQLPPEVQTLFQELAGAFQDVAEAASLAARAADAERLAGAARTWFPAQAPRGQEALARILVLVRAYAAGVDRERGRKLARELGEELVPLVASGKELPYPLYSLREACERVVKGLAVVVGAVPELAIGPPPDGEPVLARPAAGERLRTRVFVRLSNLGTSEMRDLAVSFSSQTPGLRVLEAAGPHVAALAARATAIEECGVEVADPVGGDVELRVQAAYRVGDLSLAAQAGLRLPVRPFGEPAPAALRYVTAAPVGRDRTDLFQGRERELSDLAAAFAEGRLRKLYFVNGIRAVGKSTLMHHLASRCEPAGLPLLLNLETALTGRQVTALQLVRELIRDAIRQVRDVHGAQVSTLEVPEAKAFEETPPWVLLDAFLDEARRLTGRRWVFLAFDEMQQLVKRIAAKEVDDSFLGWLRGKIQTNADLFVVCTGSEPYDVMRRRYDHTLWRNMQRYNVSFVDRGATDRIASVPVLPDGIRWLREALDRLWDTTEGHPWVTQLVAERVTQDLNEERRRVVGPGDVERAADAIAADPRIAELWWNEKDGLVTPDHRQLASLLVRRQREARQGIPRAKLVELCQKSGIHNPPKLLADMCDLQILSEAPSAGGSALLRIRGAFLERHLGSILSEAAAPARARERLPLALLVDWENVKIRLSKWLDARPKEVADALRARLGAEELARRLLELAKRHGEPAQRWAVANWDHPSFRNEQKVVRKHLFTDIAGEAKENASDHVLRERIHDTLRDHPDIPVYVIATGDADFAEVVRTLRDQRKFVVLWSTRDALSSAYQQFLTEPERFQIEWLEDLVLGAGLEAKKPG
ncbi:MAG: NYN domain-containing protein [Planctomycetes bacterium]|nr:NYN domain-containing protein [Planctomycetota bacterium]